MNKAEPSLLEKPYDPTGHLARLREAYSAGDIVALFQALSYSQQQKIETPSWVLQPLGETMIGVLQKKSGVKGKGNSAFGNLRKAFVRSVRASAYHYIRAWQRDPHRYHDLPLQTYLHWEIEPLLWQSHRKAIDAARLASTSLHGTEYVANASTVRKAANCFPEPVRWGREDAELQLGLRGPLGVFGPQPSLIKPHIKTLLSKRVPKN